MDETKIINYLAKRLETNSEFKKKYDLVKDFVRLSSHKPDKHSFDVLSRFIRLEVLSVRLSDTKSFNSQ